MGEALEGKHAWPSLILKKVTCQVLNSFYVVSKSGQKEEEEKKKHLLGSRCG